MQIIQPLSLNNVHLLGIRSSLSHPDRMLLRKEPHVLNSRSNFISSIQSKPPLATSAKFFLSRKYEPSIEPLIGWDTQDINSEFPLLELDSFDSINPPENSNINSSKSVKSSIPEILPNHIDNNTTNDSSQEINIKGKSKSKKTNKSQKPPEKKSKPKSKTTKTVKSSVAKNVTQFIDENNITINRNEDSLLASDEVLPVEDNSEIPTLQLDFASDNTENNNDYLSIITPSITSSTSSIFEDKSTFFINIANDNLEVNSEIKSSFLSNDSSGLPSEEKTDLDNNTSNSSEDSPVDFPLFNNVEEIFIPSNNFAKNEQKIIAEASESFNISDIPINPTPSKQNITTYQPSSPADNLSTASNTNLIQAKEVSPTFNSPSQKEELSNNNSNFEAITAIERDLILDSTADNFDNSLDLSPKLIPSDVDNKVYSVANDENTLETHIAATNSESLVDLSPTVISPDVEDKVYSVANDENILETHIAATNYESLVAKKPITVQQEIDSSVTSESPASTPIQLTSSSGNIEDTPSLFTNSDNNKQLVNLVTSDSQSVMAVNVSDVLENVTSLQHDSNVENTASKSTESHPILALPEIIGEAPLPSKSPEIGEAPIITTTSLETNETANIFKKVIDNEQIVESEFPFEVANPEISTFVNTSDNLRSPENEVSILPEIDQNPILPEVEQNAIAENLPAPKGYATGGHVTDSHVENRQQIAPSDTVPAMLTPGEFVINTRDAQKNLPLLHHINTGGTPHDIILPSLQIPNPQEAEETTSPETPTKVDSFPDTSLQLKSPETDSPQPSNSLIPSFLGLNIEKHQLSILNSPQLNTLQNETTDVSEPSPQYSSPPLIFRKANPTSNTSSQWSNTPSEWSSVEELLNGNNDEFTSFNFNSMESNSQNSEFSHISESPQIFAKHLPSFRGFADGGEVTPPDISREIKPVTETIDNTSSSSKGDDKNDTADLEALAREIYNRLRQRIEIERERHGGYSGRLPW